MAARHPPVALPGAGPTIKDALAGLLPQAVPRTDVLPHPVNVTEIRADHECRLRPPLRIGLVGQATTAKGLDQFLDIARDFRARYGDAVAFHLVGRAVREQRPAPSRRSPMKSAPSA